jgi:hypothetical protein
MIKYYSFFLLFIFNNILYSQSIKIVVKDSLNQNLVSTGFALKENGQFLAKANESGELIFETSETKILIGARNYKNTIYDIANNKTNICKLPKKPEELLEVVIRGKQKTIGYGNLNTKFNTFKLLYLNNSKIGNFVCATQIDIYKKSTLAFYNFRVNSKFNNSPFTFQIYNSEDGKPNQVIYNQIIENYKKGFNRIEIQDSNFKLEKGLYFIAMQWIALSDKSDVWESGEYKGKKMYASGQSLCANEGSDSSKLNYSFFNYKWYPTQGEYKSFIQSIEVYED